ncbi:acetyl-CoA acetyltransferase [Mesorhizobium australafricanum]|uniref:Acetyl-CoA acetyltransferase n=1 Tax=Mesorhizobium australafricanum TaxID=3072311 RepID=A0ABU4WWU8_9HYPH|nr:acetyl-CoA acetyltransferase [Mesorhizobium sp. VK3E]MDX8440269.1 acetyl-CoA acetyltransferase [Mesorhizobium sp. VK3E]
MPDPIIVGWAHTPFGKREDKDAEELLADVAGVAIENAGLAAEDIDAVFVGMFNSGMSKQDFPSSLVLQSVPALRFKPMARSENACASGSAAIHAGRNFLKAGQGRNVLVLGVEKMTGNSTATVGDALLGASYRKEEADVPAGFAGVFARMGQAYFQRFGDQSDALAMIAAKNHRNGVDNPYAQMRKDLGFDFCRTVSDKNPIVAAPLRRTDCSPISDGAAALVLSLNDDAANFARAVRFRAAAHVNDYMPLSRRDLWQLEGAAEAWRQAFDTAGVGIGDLSFVEVHDCFTIAELMAYEAMGLAGSGEGARAIIRGWTEKDGRLPVNRSGGLKAKGHPVGATGVSMHVLAAMQLAGEAGDLQLRKADLAGVFNMGGSGVANYVSILEAV